MRALEQLAALLRDRYRFQEGTEEQLQRGVEAVLTAEGLGYGSEVRLSPACRIDFMVGRVGVECKIKGVQSALTRQLFRYAMSDQVDALLVVTSRAGLAVGLPQRISGKPVAVVVTRGGLL